MIRVALRLRIGVSLAEDLRIIWKVMSASSVLAGLFPLI